MTFTSRTEGCTAIAAGHPARVALVSLTLIAVLAACGPKYAGTDVPAPTDPSAVVLRVLEQPGFAGPTAGAPLPEFSLYGDGRVIVSTGRRGALATADEYRLSADGYRKIYRSALAAGLGRGRTLERAPSPDAPVLTLQLLVNGTVHTTQVIAPTAGDADRRALAAFRATLRPGSWSASDRAAGPAPYRPDRLAAVATWFAARADPGAPRWPFADLAQGTRVSAGLCSVHTGAALATAVRLAAAQTPSTRWASDGNLYYVAFRPLLPDEAGCAALG